MDLTDPYAGPLSVSGAVEVRAGSLAVVIIMVDVAVHFQNRTQESRLLTRGLEKEKGKALYQWV